ncbi:MAG: alpha,alpha-trehalose-phosphate synthase (UDP-forming), partial [Pseudomonadota bacterium]
MATNNRLIIVSNRVAKPKRGAKAAGGLTVGILGALKDAGGVWFGWNGKLTSRDSRDAQLSEIDNISFATIDLNRQDYEAYYNGFSNRSLWPLLHHLLGFFSFSRSEFEGYLRVNATFARKLVPLLQPDDIIWVHDYHLIPLAAELRKAGVKNPIGFFLHVPFPGYDMLQSLPNHDYLIRSMCAYDVVGFHTQRDLASFREAVTQPAIGGELKAGNRVSVGGGTLRADVFPIGIDVREVANLARETFDNRQVREMRDSLNGRDMLIGVDRLDYSKGLQLRFRAYERLLENHPAHRKHLTLMQIAPPTRVGVRAYDEIRSELEQASGQINGRFADANWVPIRYLNKGFARATLMGFFRSAAVGLVTPVRDGMNLVAKEYVASQNPESPGMLVLSELAGAAYELDAAVLVNPYDIDDVADGINRALVMPLEERQERHAAMMAILRQNDITAWRQRFVAALTTSN